MARIIVRNTAVSGSKPTSLVQGELALNVTDGKLYYGSSSANIVREFTSSAAGGGTINTGSLLTTASFNAYTGSTTSQFAGTASFALTASSATNFFISGGITSVDYIDFDTTATVTQPTVGRVSWNDADGTLNVGLKGGNVTLQVGQEEVLRVVNKTGGNLLEADYRVVRVRSVTEGGAQGQRLAVVLAQGDNDDNSATTLGLVTENIDNNQEGFITGYGKVRGINTTGTLQGETWVDGDMIYLSPTTPGFITTTKPQAPQHTVILGYVIYAHANNGIIFVKVDNGYEIDELHNVKIDTGSLTPGQLLVRSGSVWVNTNQLTGSYGLTGSLNATSFTGSLFGTASSATSASFATTASYATTAQNVLGSITNASTASFVTASNVFGPHGSNSVVSSSHAVTASFVANISPAITNNTNNYILTATGGSTINGEANLTYDGSTLNAGGRFQQGSTTSATGNSAHAQGRNTLATGRGSHAEGQYTTGSGDDSHAEGVLSRALGIGSHAEGDSTIASGSYSHAEGSDTDALGNYSHAEGYKTNASGSYSHAEGSDTIALGQYSHAEGRDTRANGDWSHAEGRSTFANGTHSHTEGAFGIAAGDYSHVEGLGTVTSASYQHAQGQYNLGLPGQSAFIIGNGIDDTTRSNLVYASGSEFQVTGSVLVQNTDVASSISAIANIDNFAQISIQNLNGGTNASSDIVATADNGDDSVFYIDMGINSSTFNDPTLVGAAGDAYMYSTGNDLYIGNATANKEVVIFNGGPDTTTNARLWIHNQGTIAIGGAGIYNGGNPPALQINPLDTPTYNIIQAKGNVDDYAQIALSNINSGSNASTDIVAYNSTAGDAQTSGFIDMGINSPNYSDPVDFPGWTGSDAYVYSDSPRMLIGTTNTGSAAQINFIVGGTNANISSKLKLNSSSFHQLTGSLSATNGFTGSLFGTASFATTASFALNTPPTYIDNIVTVGLPGSNTNFTSIKSAVDSITDSSANNTYTVRVYPGVYIENTITMKSYISVKGDSSISTVVSASNPSQSIFVMADQSMVIDMQIQGSTATNTSAIFYSSPTTPQTNAIAYAENIRFGTNFTNATCAGSGSGNCILQCSNVKYGGFTSGSKSFDIGFHVTGSGGSIGRMQLRNVTSTNGGVSGTDDNQIFALADAPGCTFIVNGCLLTRATGTARGTGFKVYNGGQLRLTAVNFQRWINGIWAPQTGSAPNIDAIALNFENCTNDVLIQHTGSIGKIQGTDTFLKTIIPYEAPLYEVATDQRKILVNKKGGDFTSISASVAYITDSSENNRYAIEVGPGQFTEKQIDLRGKPYVSIIGSTIQTTQILASGSGNYDQVLLGPTNEISFLSINGVNAVGQAAIKVDGTGDNFAQAHKVSIYDFDYGIKVLSSVSSSTFYGEYIDINGAFSYGTFVSSSNTSSSLASIENYYLFPSGGLTVGNYVTGPNAELDLYTCLFKGDNLSGSQAIKLENGATVEASGIDVQAWGCGLIVPNSGSFPTFRIVGGMIHNSIVSDFDIQKVGTRGRFQGISDHSKINNVSEDFFWNFLDDTDGENDVTRKLSVTFADGTHTDATTLIFKGSPMGVMQGGDITISGSLKINVAAGFGYLENSINPDIYQRIDWTNSTASLSPNTENYIYFDQNESLLASNTSPNNTQNIILGRVVTNATTIEFIDQSPFDAAHTSNKLSKFNREALGPVFAQGSTVTQNVTPFTLNVTAGSYFFSENNFQPSGTSSINLNRYYTSGSDWNRSTSSIVPNNVYASGSQLIPMSASYFTKHIVYLVGEGVDEKYFLLINDNQYSSLVNTEAANLPAAPIYFNDGVVPLAAVYVQSGSANITQIQDVRPIIGFRTAGVNASSVHSNLSGLAADDHTQYLLVNGTRQMSGNLGLGGNTLFNFSNVSGSKVQTTQLTSSFASITSITGSLFGTASSATSASFATTASYALNGGVTQIVAGTNVTITNGGSGSVTINSSGGGGAAFPFTGAAVITGSLLVSGSGTAGQQGSLSTGDAALLFGGFEAVNWKAKSLKDDFGNPSINWTDRQLSDSVGNIVLDYETAQLVGTASYATTASYALNGGSGAAFPYTGDAVITGSLAISQSLLQYSSTTAITVGAAVNIASFPTSSYRAGFFDYVAFSGVNTRAGTVMSVWNGANVEFNETSTNDIGSTSALTLSASLSGANIRLQGVSTSGTWTVETLARLI